MADSHITGPLTSANGFIGDLTGSSIMTRAVVAAAGSSASDAAVIATQIALVTGANGTVGVALPAAATTVPPILVINTSATASLLVYPVNGGDDNINSLTGGAAFVLSSGRAAWFVPSSATQWYAEDASPYANGRTQTAKVSTQFDAVTGTTGVTLTNVVGAVLTVVPGTYKFKVDVSGVATANSGMKLGFKYTTTVLSSMESVARGFTASGVVVQHSTTATDAATLLGSTTAIINGVLEGTMVVTTGGTIQLQAAQNAAHVDTTSVYVGSTMQFTRIA